MWLLLTYFASEVSGTDLQAYRLGSGPTGTEWSCECVVKDDIGSCTTDDGLGRTHTLDLSEGYDGSLNFPVMEVYVIPDEYSFEVGLTNWQWPSGAGYVGSYVCRAPNERCGTYNDELLKVEPISSATREEHEL